MTRFASIRRMLAIMLLALWWGGFTFYAGRVVFIGHEVLRSKVRQAADTFAVALISAFLHGRLVGDGSSLCRKFSTFCWSVYRESVLVWHYPSDIFAAWLSHV